MERHNNITLLGITNFLEQGALLRRKDQWILIEGPFRPLAQPSESDLCIYAPAFYGIEGAAYWVGSRRVELKSEELRGLCEDYLASEGPGSLPHFVEPRYEDFAASFQIIQNRILQGQIEKAVPVVFARAASQDWSPRLFARSILSLLQAPPALHVYGFWQKGAGILGATPETLFEYEEGTLKTMALAGTCPRSDQSERASLLEDLKERQEHELVRQDILGILKKFGAVSMSQPYILELPTLLHLKTDFEVRCGRHPDFHELILKLHPTPALGVAPRTAGYTWMKELPGQEGREGFGAPFAIIEKGLIDCLVAIRCVQWSHNSLQIGSGCGIVAASKLDQEWRELEHKRLSVKRIMGWL